MPEPSPDPAQSPLAGGSARESADWLRVAVGAWDEADEFAGVPADAPEDLKHLDQYRVTGFLGEGAFGEVWAARQLFPVARPVAIKVLKAGMDRQQIVARFEQERQTLAIMDHAGIATIYDGGTTSAGRPYFAMERVDGPPVTEFCDAKEFSTRRRVELFIEICRAVHHAHQKGALHRDLKPSNILVGESDGVPQPKVIDFGIAKIVGEIDSMRSALYTMEGSILGTPAYMSPEQVTRGSEFLDTRADIYALGVILYELLTGRTPLFPSGEITRLPISELTQRICSEEPRRPSSLAWDATETELAARGVPNAKALARELHGDIDWILLKALAKEREQRYDSAAAFAEDLRRHLQDLPVSVGRPTVAQSFAKFARRNRVLVAAAVLSTVALAVATGVSSYAFVREAHMRLRAEQNAAEAQRQTKKAQNTLKYLDALLSRAAALADGGANAEALRLALDEVTLEIPSFTDDPDLRETIVGRAAVIYRQIGYEDKAIPLLRIELEIAEKKYGPNARETTDILGRCARALSIQSQHQEAIKMAADTVRRRELEIQDEKSPYWLFVAKRDYADILKRAGRLPEALAAGRKLLNSAGPDIRSEDGWTFFVRSHAGALREAGRYEEAIGLLEETLAELALRTKGVDHDRSSLLMEEARVRRAMGNVPECARLLSLSIQAEEKAYGPNGRNLSALYVELSRPLDLQNQCEQAVNHCRHAVDIAVAIDDQAQALAATRALAENLENAGRFTESGEQWRAAARRGDALGRELYVVLTDLASAARAFARAGSTEEANKIAAEIDSKWSAISLKARAVSNRRLIRSALAYVAAADAARTGRPVPLDWRLTLHELAEEDLAKFETSLPAARDILARLRGGANPEGLAPPDASALLAFDRALNDRWSDFDKSGPWFHLAACCRLRSRPDLALQIYETVASWPKEEFRIASRRTLAQLHGAACLIQLSRSSEVKSIIESVRAEIDRDARLIPSPLAVAMVKALEAQIDLAGQKNSPD